jgi:transposase-like protein
MTAPLIEIRCPECGSNRVRRGKENDNVIRCTCKSCGKLFEFDVVKEEVVKPNEQ